MVKKLSVALIAAVVVFAALQSEASQERVLICHLKDHQVGSLTDHIGPCTAEEHLAGGRNITVLANSLYTRHGIVQ